MQIEQHKANDHAIQIEKLKLQVELDAKELESNRNSMSNLLRDNQTFQQRACADADRIKRDDAKLVQAQDRNEVLYSKASLFKYAYLYIVQKFHYHLFMLI